MNKIRRSRFVEYALVPLFTFKVERFCVVNHQNFHLTIMRPFRQESGPAIYEMSCNL